MMMVINMDAWEILTDDEKTAVTLKHGHAKSTWQAGEIMGKAHYKFLEIEARAEKFLKMFTEHLNLYEALIPNYIQMDKRFRTYMQLTIGSRYTVKEAVEHIKDKEYSSRQFREECIMKEIERLLGSKTDVLVKQGFVQMIFDFDRWNNFRILPAAIQEPSAFKRRNKNVEKANVKRLLTLNEYQVNLILDRYQALDNPNLLYMPIPSRDKNNKGYGVIQVLSSTSNITELSKFGFYLFAQKEHAWEFYDLIRKYSFNRKEEKNTCRIGQAFWPQFRDMLKKTINANGIQKRIISRTYLETAFPDGDHRVLKKIKEKANPNKKGRLNDESGSID